MIEPDEQEKIPSISSVSTPRRLKLRFEHLPNAVSFLIYAVATLTSQALTRSVNHFNSRSIPSFSKNLFPCINWKTSENIKRNHTKNLEGGGSCKKAVVPAKRTWKTRLLRERCSRLEFNKQMILVIFNSTDGCYGTKSISANQKDSINIPIAVQHGYSLVQYCLR